MRQLAVTETEAVFLRHAISVALRDPVFDESQRESLLRIENRLAEEETG